MQPRYGKPRQSNFDSRKAPQYRGQWNSKTKYSESRPCTQCGKGKRPRDKCPARDAICHCCHNKGHYRNCCRTKLDELEEGSGSEDMDTISEHTIDSAFLDAVGDTTNTCWTETISLNGKDLTFKLDTGVEVTAITEEIYQMLNAGLSPLLITLYGPGQVSQGRFQGEFTHKGKQTIQSVYVISTLKRNLLGLPTIQALNLTVRVDAMTQPSGCAVADKFPAIFQGLGNFGENYSFKLKPGATSYAIYKPRHVVMPLRFRVKQEFDCMELLNVISKVEEPTSWCAGMVVVPKKNGTIRICVDLKPLNESVQLEVSPTSSR